MVGINPYSHIASEPVCAETSATAGASNENLATVSRISNCPLSPDTFPALNGQPPLLWPAHDRRSDSAGSSKMEKKSSKVRSSLWLKNEVWNWIKAYPIEKNTDGKANLTSVATLIITYKKKLLKTGVRWKEIAEYYEIPENSLYTYISDLSRPLPAVTELNEKQKSWLMIKLQDEGLIGEFSVPALARFYVKYQTELTDGAINLQQLAKYNEKNPRTLKKRVNEVKSKDSLVKINSRAKAFAWLDKNGVHINYPGKVTTQMVARFFIKNSALFDQRNFFISHLSQYYKIFPATLYSAIEKIRTAIIPDKLDPAKVAWLKAHAPTNSSAGKVPISKVAAFYLTRKIPLKNQSITLKNLGTFYKYRPTRILVASSRLKKNKYQLPVLTVEERFWFSHKLMQPGQTGAVTIADYHKNAPDNFERELLQFRKVKNAGAQPLTAAAKKMLKAMPFYGKVTSTELAQYYLDNITQFVANGINHAAIADHFYLSASTLLRQIRIQIKIRAADSDSAILPVVKTEPVSDSAAEVEPWYKAQPFRDMPVLLWPDDEEIALGHLQGPLREKLASVDLTTLRITRSPEFPALLSNRRLHAAANARLHKMVNAACNGTLKQLIRDEGYFQLLIDEQHPELGMGLYATRPIPRGFLLGIYPGVVYSSYQQFLQASSTVDASFPVYAFETSSKRPRRAADDSRKKPARLTRGIGGHLQNGPLVYANTAAVAANGRVIASAKNNLAAAIAGKEIVVFVTTRQIDKDEALLINYGNKYQISLQPPVKQEPPDE